MGTGLNVNAACLTEIGVLIILKKVLLFGTVLLMAGCSSYGKGMLPHPSAARTGPAASDAAAGLPGDAAAGLPGDAAAGLPGDAAAGLPGDAAAGLPGATFACAPALQTGTASCTLAINLNVSPLADPLTPADLIPGFHPADLQSVYNLPSQAVGRTVAIVDAYDDPAAESDLAVYRTAFGLSPCTTQNGCFRKINQAGQAAHYPQPNPGWSQEIALDLDMVSAACPNCRILLVEANSSLMDDLGASVDTASRFGPAAISNSYYALEWPNELGEDVHYRHPGIAITASSGDRVKPSYPAASQYVTSVGGTHLAQAMTGGWTESAWTYGGRGCSAYVSKPGWQWLSSCTTRSAVDIAAVADPQTGVSMFASASGGWLVAGGTSVGAPLVAAAYALSGNPQGPAYSYFHRAAFHTIVSRYTLATGLGSPNGVGGL